MQEITQEQPAKFGLLGFLLAIASLVVILIQMSAFFEPAEKSSGTFIGELAAEIKQSAARALSGAPAPEAVAIGFDYSQLITVAALSVAAIAIVLGGIGLYRKEPYRLPYLAVGVGLSAFVLLYVFWLAVLICGVALLVSVIQNLDSILE